MFLWDITLCIVQFLADVPGKNIGLIFKGQEMFEFFSRNVTKETPLYAASYPGRA